MNYLNTHLLHPVGVTTEPWHQEKSESFEADPSFGCARPIVNQDPLLSEEMVKEAIASAEINAQLLTRAVRIYIPKSKYAEAQPWLEQLSRPGGGYTASQSEYEGNWFDLSKNTWVPEAMVVATSFMTAEMLQRHLALILQGCHLMGKALKEQAVAIEIISPGGALMLIIETE